MASFDCEACGGKHRLYERWLECQTKQVRTACGCPNYWRLRREAGIWNSHSPGCPLRDKGGS